MCLLGEQFILFLLLFFILPTISSEIRQPQHRFIRIQTLHTFFKCWKRSKKEPSLENTFAGLALWTLGFELAVVEGDEAEGAGEAYPLVLACGTGVPLEDLCDMSYVEVLKLRTSRRVSSYE